MQLIKQEINYQTFEIQQALFFDMFENIQK